MLSECKLADLQTLAGHTVDISRLPERPFVLDVGCRGFDFCREVLAVRPKAKITALDPDPSIQPPVGMPRVNFYNLALTHDERPTSRYASYSTGEGNMLTDAESYYDARMLTVKCVDMGTLMFKCHLHKWDLVKLDCEGSEFDILMNWPGPIADQISVEFHDGHPEEHGSHRAEREGYFSALWKHLAGYKVVQHELFKQGDWYGHWDTLLVANST